MGPGAPGAALEGLSAVARAVGLRVELVGGRTAATFDVLGARWCHLAALERPDGQPRLVSVPSLVDDPCIRAVTVAAKAADCPVEFVTPSREACGVPRGRVAEGRRHPLDAPAKLY